MRSKFYHQIDKLTSNSIVIKLQDRVVHDWERLRKKWTQSCKCDSKTQLRTCQHFFLTILIVFFRLFLE